MALIAERIRNAADIPVASAWGIDLPQLAEHTVAQGQLDLVMVGRAHLSNPHWPYDTAKALRVEAVLGITRPLCALVRTVLSSLLKLKHLVQ